MIIYHNCHGLPFVITVYTHTHKGPNSGLSFRSLFSGLESKDNDIFTTKLYSMARLRPRRFVHLQLRRRAQERATVGGGEMEERWFQLCNEHPGTRQRWEEKERKKKVYPAMKPSSRDTPGGGRKKEKEKTRQDAPSYAPRIQGLAKREDWGCSRGAWTGSSGFLCTYG